MPKKSDGPDIFSLTNGISDKDFENVVKDALKKGIDINKQKRGSLKTLLHEAILAKNEHRAKILIELGANVNKQDAGGETPLHSAVSRDLEAIAELLLKNRADVNAQEADMNTPLHDAVYGNKRNIAKLLVNYGADINKENDSGNTPLSIAKTRYGQEWFDLIKGETGRKEKEEQEIKELVDKLMTGFDRRTEFDWMVVFEAIDKIKDLDKLDRVLTQLRKKIGNSRFIIQLTTNKKINNDYATVLGHAINGNNIELAELLLKHGSDINEVCFSSPTLTPLCIAVRSGNIKMIEFLLKNGADKSSYKHCTPFEVAVNTNNFEVAEFLVKQGFPVRKHEPIFRSVFDSPDLKQLLCEAVLNDNVKLAELIIKHGGDKYINEIYDMNVNIRVNKIGNSIRLLVIALKNKSKDMIRLLLSHHADPYLYKYDVDDEESPVNFAEKMGDEWITFLIGKDGYEEKKRKDKERREKYEKRRKEYERAYGYYRRQSNSQEGNHEQNDSDSEDEEFELPPAKYIEIPTEGTIEDKWKKIKKQYLLLTRQHHPDKGGDENIFKELNNEFHAIQNVMRNKYKDKIDVFHGGKRKQSTKKKLRNKNQRGKSMRR